MSQVLDMKRRHAAEENCGAIGINIFIYPFGPSPQYSIINCWPIDLLILCCPFIERSFSVWSNHIRGEKSIRHLNKIDWKCIKISLALTKLSLRKCSSTICKCWRSNNPLLSNFCHAFRLIQAWWFCPVCYALSDHLNLTPLKREPNKTLPWHYNPAQRTKIKKQKTKSSTSLFLVASKITWAHFTCKWEPDVIRLLVKQFNSLNKAYLSTLLGGKSETMSDDQTNFN